MDPGVGVGRAHHEGAGRSVRRGIVGEPALAGQQPLILRPPAGGADLAGGGLCHGVPLAAVLARTCLGTGAGAISSGAAEPGRLMLTGPPLHTKSIP